MPRGSCSASTKNGNRCKRKPYKRWYCKQHRLKISFKKKINCDKCHSNFNVSISCKHDFFNSITFMKNKIKKTFVVFICPICRYERLSIDIHS